MTRASPFRDDDRDLLHEVSISAVLFITPPMHGRLARNGFGVVTQFTVAGGAVALACVAHRHALSCFLASH